jgi:hypothetical protein
MVDGERPVLEDVLRIWTRSYACSSIGFAVVRGHQPVFACPSHCWSGDIDGAVWTDMGTDVGKGRRGDCVQSAVDRGCQKGVLGVLAKDCGGLRCIYGGKSHRRDELADAPSGECACKGLASRQRYVEDVLKGLDQPSPRLIMPAHLPGCIPAQARLVRQAHLDQIAVPWRSP